MNLPIAERELRLAARTPRTYRGRLIVCVIFGAITSWLFWFTSVAKLAPIATVAPQTFAFIAHMALLMCMFSISVTADSLSSEKRNGTLGLLFLTDLKGRDIVFGKLAALGLMAFYSLVGIIPILTMPLLMGGISGQTVFRTSLTLMNSLFLALSLGLWVSARSWEQKRAMNGGIWLAVFLMWLVPGAGALLRLRFPHLGVFIEYSELLSPMYQQNQASPFGVGMRGDKYWLSLGITHILAWLAIWRACAILPHAWQDRPVLSAVGRFKKFLEELRYGSSSVRAKLRARLLSLNAVHWLSSRERFAPFNSWLFVFVVVLGWVGLWVWIKIKVPGGGGPPFWGLGIPGILILYLGFRIRTCTIAGEVIARDRFSGALELLLSTTLTERDVARGQWLTFCRTILAPAIASAVIATYIFLAAMYEAPRDEAGLVTYVFLALLILFACDLVASVWTGMWAACFARTQQAAAGQAVIRLLLLPFLIFVAVMSTFAWLHLGQGMEFVHGFTFVWLLCMSNNLFWIYRSRRMFYERLRIAAAERYQAPTPKSPWWRFGRRASASAQIGLSNPV